MTNRPSRAAPTSLAERYATLAWVSPAERRLVTVRCLKRIGAFDPFMGPRGLLPEEMAQLDEVDFDPSKKSAG